MSFNPVVASLIVPLLVNAPRLKLPRLRVMSILPLGLKVPPVWLKSVPTVMLPLPPREPEDRLTIGAESEPFTVSAAPAMPSVVPALIPNIPETSSAPPDRIRFSSESMLSRGKLPAVIVTVCRPGTLMRTRCPVVGCEPVLQLDPIAQSPLPPIQQSSTAQPVAKENVAVVAP